MMLRRNIVYQDNMSTILMGQNGRSSCSRHSCHLNVRYFYVTDTVKQKEMEIVYCLTEVILANFYETVTRKSFQTISRRSPRTRALSSLYQNHGSFSKERITSHNQDGLECEKYLKKDRDFIE